MNRPRLVYCGKCGNPNPADNLYCRGCGHRLDDDVVTPEEIDDLLSDPGGEPIAPIEGVELKRFPLVHPESGEIVPIDLQRSTTPSRRSIAPGAPRAKVILYSLGVHLLVVTFCLLVGGFGATLMLPMPGDGVAQPQNDQLIELQQRFERGDMTREQLLDEVRRLFGLTEAQFILTIVIVMASLVVGFFLSGMIAGRLWRPERVMDTVFGVMLLGLLLALAAPGSIMLWMLGVPVSLVGALIGRRMGAPRSGRP